MSVVPPRELRSPYCSLRLVTQISDLPSQHWPVPCALQSNTTPCYLLEPRVIVPASKQASERASKPPSQAFGAVSLFFTAAFRRTPRRSSEVPVSDTPECAQRRRGLCHAAVHGVSGLSAGLSLPLARSLAVCCFLLHCYFCHHSQQRTPLLEHFVPLLKISGTSRNKEIISPTFHR